MGEILLPGLAARTTVNFTSPLAIVAGGRPPLASWLKEFLHGRELWCADSGLAPCVKAGFWPSRLVGDGDSAPPSLWEEALSGKTEVEVFPADKDYTDLQLALFRAGETGRRHVIVSGCWGGRFDHLWSAVNSALWALKKGTRVLAFADHSETLFLLLGGETWEIDGGSGLYDVLSLIPLGGDCRGVTLEGARWTLSGETLSPHRPFAVSNRFLDGKKPRISLEKGILGVYVGTA